MAPRVVSGPEITGLVTNKQTGTPIGGATVTVSATVYTDPDFTSGTTTLTADGTGVFFCYASRGTYTFTTTAVGAGPIESVTVRGGGGPSSGASTGTQQVYVESGGAYALTGGRKFVGTDDPSTVGYTLTDADEWVDLGSSAPAVVAVGQSVAANALAQQSAWGGGGTAVAPTPLISTTSPLGITRRWASAPASLGAYMEFVFYLTAGTYQPVLAMSSGPDRGIFKLRMGSTDVQTAMDGYAASSGGVMFGGIATYVVSADGLVTVRLEVTGKNASSTAYQLGFSGLSLTRTA